MVRHCFGGRGGQETDVRPDHELKMQMEPAADGLPEENGLIRPVRLTMKSDDKFNATIDATYA